jgi:hypothetical protein
MPDLHHSQGVKVSDVLARADDPNYTPQPGDPAYDRAVAAGFKPVKPDDMTDVTLLPRRFEAFASEVRAEFRTLGERILPSLERVEATMSAFRKELDRAVSRVSDLEQRQAATESKVLELQLDRAATRTNKATRRAAPKKKGSRR